MVEAGAAGCGADDGATCGELGSATAAGTVAGVMLDPIASAQ
jgi:hypothetical protein